MSKANYHEADAPADATTVAEILPKLRDDQRQWISDLSRDERQVIEEILQREGEAYFLSVYGFLVRDLEYVRTL